MFCCKYVKKILKLRLSKCIFPLISVTFCSKIFSKILPGAFARGKPYFWGQFLGWAARGGQILGGAPPPRWEAQYTRHHNVCQTCPVLNTDLSYICSFDNKRYQTLHRNHSLCCSSTNLVYLLTCSDCGFQYVGETSQKLSIRVGQHRRSIENHRKKSIGNPDAKIVGCPYVVQHFTENNGCSSFRVNILEKLPQLDTNQATTELRRKRELFYIATLKTKYPFGMNDLMTGFDFDLPVIHNMNSKGRKYCKKHNKGVKKSRSKRNKSDMSSIILQYLKSIHPSDARKESWHILNQLNKVTLKAIYHHAMYNVVHNKVVTDVIKEIINFKLHVDRNNTGNNKPNDVKCMITFENNAIELCSFRSVFDDCKMYWPLNTHNYKTSYHSPSPIYKYKEPISKLLFNYNYTIRNYKHEDYHKLPCSCQLYSDNYKVNGHVVTGDLSLISNDRVRDLFEKGPKYRLSAKTDVDKCLESLHLDLSAYVDRIANRLNKDVQLFKFWIKHVLNKWHALATHRHKHRTTYATHKDETLNREARRCITHLKRNFVIGTVDKAAQNFSLICKKFYIDEIYRTLGVDTTTLNRLVNNDGTYRHLRNTTPAEIINVTARKSKEMGFVVPTESMKLPNIYIIPKFHKNPVKFRTIIGSANCTTKGISTSLGKCLSLVQKSRRKYCEAITRNTGQNYFWVIDNNQPILSTLNKLSVEHRLTSIETYDFTTLYTKLRHSDIYKHMDTLIHKCMTNLNISRRGQVYLWTHSQDANTINKEQLSSLIHFVVDNTYFTFGDMVFKQTVGIPMGTSCAPQLANLMLHQLEYAFLERSFKSSLFSTCNKLNLTYRYIDDITVINGHGILDQVMDQIYPGSLRLEKVNADPTIANVLDINIKILRNKTVSTSTYDKRRDYEFNITNFPHAHGNVPEFMRYNVFCAQVTRHSLLNSEAKNFRLNMIDLIDKLLARGYALPKLLDKLVKTVKIKQIDKKYKDSSLLDRFSYY